MPYQSLVDRALFYYYHITIMLPIKLQKLKVYSYLPLVLCIAIGCTSYSPLFIKESLDFETITQQQTTSAIAPDSSFIIFAYNNTTNPNDSDLFIAYQQADKTWGIPKRLAISFEKTDDISPAISRDGKRLYFSSNRINGYGGYDLWVARLDSTGKAYATRNLGAKINTNKDEKFPFVNSRGKLYFASNGHLSKGKLDLLEATRRNGKIKVRNLGDTFNSKANDFGLIYLTDTSGYYYTDRKGSLDTIHFVNKTPKFRYFLTIEVLAEDSTSQTDIPLPNSTVEIYEGSMVNKKFLKRLTTDAQGLIKNFPVKPQKEYVIKAGNHVNTIKYFTTEEEYSMFGKEADPNNPHYDQVINHIHLKSQVYLRQESLGCIGLVVPTVLYRFNAQAINTKLAFNQEWLDKMFLFLKNNPQAIIEIGSHTDERGSAIYNFNLSQKRANTVAHYFITKGISPKRLKAKGYGETDLKIKHAKSEAEHQENCRTTFRVIGFIKR